jgi:hypothetical protein
VVLVMSKLVSCLASLLPRFDVIPDLAKDLRELGDAVVRVAWLGGLRCQNDVSRKPGFMAEEDCERGIRQSRNRRGAKRE